MNQDTPKTNESSLESSTESKKATGNIEQATEEKPQGTGFWSTVQSVLGAMFGVQTEQQREKDFEKGSAVQFIVGGIIFVVVFILTILYFVNSALESAGAG
ncbi:DUF2970 domain-containing protein [Kangiella geojedonensis]|uniref:DUF2970 domain-containing protein n=1 Tax=Kangiella geojedonensis TaxID=914150 RepID=A0A0F6RBC6_9GAMM|nr:DUF2970 domain-containing protein [Kangiella geojedonensis]AKE51438.1 hypothetical protein TQ33_0452 [Kangiella geojedonensis]